MPIGALIEKTTVEESPLAVVVAGEKLTFRRFGNYSSYNQYVRDASKQVKLLRKQAKSLPGKWGEYLAQVNDSSLLEALMLSKLSVEPAIEELEALELCVKCGPAFATIIAECEQANGRTIAEGEMEAVEAAGEPSGAMLSGEAS